MGVIEIIKKGFIVATRNFGLVAIFIIYSLIDNLMNIKFAGTSTTAVITSLTGLMWTGILVLITIFVRGGSLGIIRDYIKEGKVALSKFTAYGIKYYLRLLGLGLAIILVGIILTLIASLLMIVPALLGNEAVLVVVGILALVVEGIGIYLIILMAVMSPYLIICNDAHVIEAMTGSIDITRSVIGKVLLLLIIFGIISLCITAIVNLLSGGNQVIIGIVTSIFNGYFSIAVMASFMTLYLSLTTE